MSAARDTERLAAAFLVRREQPGWTDADRHELATWLAADPGHKAAFWRLEYGWGKTDRLRARRSGAPAAATAANDRRTWLALAACLVLVVAISAGLLSGREGRTLAPVRIATAVGAQRDATLADGSHLIVNTDSVVRTAVSRVTRNVWLDRGEAYFQVAHDPSHPFTIHAGDRRITVLGTRFAVRRDGDTVRVSVVEGRVQVDGPRPGLGTAAIVTAGDVAVARGASLLVVNRSPVIVDEALSWRDGMLTFDRTTLADAAAEFNRYNHQQLRIADDRAARLRIGGTFEATNVAAFARLLHSAFGLEVRQDDKAITVDF